MNMHEGCWEDDSGIKSTCTSVKKEAQVPTSDIKTYTPLTRVRGSWGMARTCGPAARLQSQ